MGREGIADRGPVYIPCRRDVKKRFLGCIHFNKVTEKGKAQIRKMDVILRIRICILRNMIILKLEYAGKIWVGNAKLVKSLETVPITAAEKILGDEHPIIDLSHHREFT